MLRIIVAHDKNQLIGNGMLIPWHIKEDFQHYKNTTMGHTLIMGTTTFTSIGKPLPGRKTIILSFDDKFPSQGCEICTDYKELVNRYEKSEEIVYVCGGASVYKLFLPYCDELIISEIKGDYEGNVYFPPYKDKFVPYKTDKRELFDIIYYRRKDLINE